MLTNVHQCLPNLKQFRKAFDPGFRWVDGHLRITWQIEPIPAYAEVLTFKITEIGKWKGPWIFRVNLKT